MTETDRQTDRQRQRETDEKGMGGRYGQTDGQMRETERQRENISYNYTTLQVTFVD